MVLRRPFTLKNIEFSRLLNPGKWSLKARVLVTSAAFLSMGIAALGIFVAFTLQNTFQKSIEDRLLLVEESIRNELRKDQETLLSQVSAIAAIPEVVRHLAAQDRNGLLSYVLPYLDRVRTSTGLRTLFFHFHVQSGASFFRTWNVNEWQDDISKSRLMVARVNKEFVPLAGIDRGHKGLSLRTIIPLMNGVEHIGSVEAGITMEEVFQSLHLPARYGAAIVLTEATGGESEKPASPSAENAVPFVKATGSVSMEAVEAVAADKRVSGRYNGLSFRRMGLSDFQGQSIGSIFLFLDDYQLLQEKGSKVSNFIWLAIVGSVVMWYFLFLNVTRMRSFVSQLKRIVLTAQSSNFASRFKTDHIHCREILHCDQDTCPIYTKPYLICYLEVGSEAVIADGYKSCGFLDQYKTCSACPVYKTNLRDELTELKWLVNTLMRVLNLFLIKSTRLFSEVFGTRTTAQSLSLDEVSRHLEQMSYIAAFSRSLRGVLNKDEAYRLLASVFEKDFHLDNYVLMEVSNSENRMEVVAGNLQCSSPSGEDVRMDCTLCRANRVAEAVCSYHNVVLCSFFNCDSTKEFRTCLPMVMGGRVGAVFSFIAPVDKGPLWRDLMFILRRYLDVAAPVLSSMRLLQLTTEQAMRDPLTRCHNRRFMDEYLDQYETLSQRHGKKVGFLMADIDYFKQVNDQYGHQTGDYVLQEISSIIRENIRKSDLLIRYGGEEFLVILLEISSETTRVVAEKVRLAVEKHQFQVSGGITFQKTISIGISEYPEDADLFHKAIKFADVALYQAKQGGRNSVVRFEPAMWTYEEY